MIYRPAVDPLGAQLRLLLCDSAAGCCSAFSAPLLDLPSLIAGAGTVLLMSGLGVVVAAGDLIYLRRQRFLRLVWAWIIAAPALFVIAITLAQPWILGTEVRTMLPARDIGAFFADSFQRRTGQPLAAVAGDPQLATLIAYAAPRRPHLLLDATPKRRRGRVSRNSTRPAAWSSGAPPTPPARRRTRSPGASRGSCRKCRARFSAT